MYYVFICVYIVNMKTVFILALFCTLKKHRCIHVYVYIYTGPVNGAPMHNGGAPMGGWPGQSNGYLCIV